MLYPDRSKVETHHRTHEILVDHQLHAKHLALRQLTRDIEDVSAKARADVECERLGTVDCRPKPLNFSHPHGDIVKMGWAFELMFADRPPTCKVRACYALRVYLKTSLRLTH